MQAIGDRKLTKFQLELWKNVDEKLFGMLPPPIFLPDTDIKQIRDSFVLLTTVQELAYLFRHNKFLSTNFDAMFAVVCELEKEFDVI